VRIVAGRFKGRSLAAPTGPNIRPTSDRVREAVFNVLSHSVADFTPEGARALDLFAGTGALGLEALSRGAQFALFVDNGAEARALVRQNIEAFGVAGIARLFRRDATSLGKVENFAAFDLVFADPPYGQGLGERALGAASLGGWIADNAVVVLEEASDMQVSLPAQFTAMDQRSYGDTSVHFLRYRLATT